MDRVEFALDLGGSFTFEVRSKSGIELTPASEAKVAAALLPAMQEGRDLKLRESIEPAFAENIEKIQDIYSTWYEKADQVAVQASLEDSRLDHSKRNTAVFFTGGVDSFYTLLKHRKEIDALIYVHGFDINLKNTPLRRKVSKMIHEVAEHFNKEAIEIETNLRHWSDGKVQWERYHGAALASIALTLRESFDRIFIASTHPYDRLKPWGSSPLLDPLWGGDTINIVHDGCEASWMERCHVIGNSKIAKKTLRVCWKNENGNYNCGNCEKCIRTMIQLLACESLNEFESMTGKINREKIYSNEDEIRSKYYYYEKPLRILKNKGIRHDLVKELELIKEKNKVIQTFKRVIYNIRRKFF